MDFRVSVCLSRYYNDERSYCYVYLDSKYDTVASFAEKLKQQFRLKNDFCLMTNNNLLPNEETIKIIHTGDKITVVPIQNNWWDDQEPENAELEINTNETVDVVDSVAFEKAGKKKKKKKSKPDTTEQAHYNDEDATPIKKEKSHSVETDNHDTPKKKGSLMDVSMMSPSEQENGDNGNEDTTDDNSRDTDLTNEPQNNNEIQSAIQQLKIKALTLLTEVSSQKQVAGVSGGRINKRKRIRKRNKNSSLSMSTPDLSESATSAPITFKPVIKSSSHIRFDNTDQPMGVSNTVRNSDITTKPRIIRAVETNSNTNSRRTSICGSGDNINHNSHLERAVPNNLVSANKDNQRPEINIESVKKRLNEFPVMDNVYPVEKDLVLFKMLKMGNDYTPSISDYILGNVIEVDKSLGVVNIYILDGHKECLPVVGKFDLDTQPPEQESNENFKLDVVWSQVNEARLIFP